MQLMLDELTEWGNSCNLKFNPTKTVALIFSRKQITPLTNLQLNGDRINFSDSVLYLGIELDNKLYWRTHISNKVAKAPS